MRRKGLSLVFVLGISLFRVPIQAQTLESVAPPEGSEAQASPALQPLAPSAGDPLFAPLVTSPGPPSEQDRFMDYAIQTFGPRALFVPPVVGAAWLIDPPNRLPRDWRLGAGAFGRNTGNAFVAETSLQTARFLSAGILHEDFRYRPSTSRNPAVRAWHALAFTFVDKSDSGNNRVAFANFLGAGAGGFVGNLYLPAGFNDLSHGDTRTAFVFGGFAIQNVLREFTPDLLRFSNKRHTFFPRIPLPEWWAKLRAR